jgi:cobalt-zinc-cadmium efflux system outer membrane protein
MTDTQIALRRSRHAVIVGLVLASTAPGTAAQTLEFSKAIHTAATSAPAVLAAEQRASAAASIARVAGALPDPALVIAIDNLPVDGSDAFSVSRDFMTMRRIGIAQMLPSRSRRAALRSVSAGEVDLARAAEALAAIDAVSDVAAAWTARHGIEAQLSLVDAMARENERLARAARAQFAAGAGTAFDLTLPREESLAIEALRDDLGARRRTATARLRRWLGALADLPLQGAPPTFEDTVVDLSTGLAQHPDLRALDARAEVATARIGEARAARNPDWGIALDYQQRGPAFSNMISVQVTVDLRLFQSERQQPLIDARRSELSAVAAERAASLAQHAERLESALAEIDRLSRARLRQRDFAVPLAHERTELAASAWRAGRGSLQEWIAARRSEIASRLQAIELDTAWLTALQQVHFAYSTAAIDAASDASVHASEVLP